MSLRNKIVTTFVALRIKNDSNPRRVHPWKAGYESGLRDAILFMAEVYNDDTLPKSVKFPKANEDSIFEAVKDELHL